MLVFIVLYIKIATIYVVSVLRKLTLYFSWSCLCGGKVRKWSPKPGQSTRFLDVGAIRASVYLSSFAHLLRRKVTFIRPKLSRQFWWALDTNLSWAVISSDQTSALDSAILWTIPTCSAVIYDRLWVKIIIKYLYTHNRTNSLVYFIIIWIQ